jgi:hypothetical protein
MADLHELKRSEAALHDSDFLDGSPLDIGDGYSVAFHSDSCRYCLFVRALEEMQHQYEDLSGPQQPS